MDIEALGYEVLLPLGVAFVSGMILGLERELSHKPAGLRTQILVALGAASFVLAARSAFPGDVARVAANVVTGLGFLGAGVILQKQGNVRGLTTSALVWLNGALGVAAAMQNYAVVAAGGVLALVALRVVGRLERWMGHRCRVVNYEVVASDGSPVAGVVEEELHHCHLQEGPVTFDRHNGQVVMRFAFCNPPDRHHDFVRRLRDRGDVSAVRAE